MGKPLLSRELAALGLCRRSGTWTVGRGESRLSPLPLGKSSIVSARRLPL